MGEGRKWKNKKKKDKKQKKKNRRRWKEVVHEDIQEENEAENVDVAVKETEAPFEININEIPEIKDEENASEEKQGQGQVLQFSAYSGASSQPVYQARPNHNQIYEDEKEDGGRRKYLYSVDYQGNSHYIDEEDVSALLKTPAAKKAMMKYFHKTNNGELQFPEENQMSSYFRTEHDYHQYRAPHERLSTSYHPEQQRYQEPSSSFPSLEYFGPKDYVPESPYLLQGGQDSTGVFSYENQFQGGLPAVKKHFFEKLEPKPRSLFKRDVDEPLETIKSRFALKYLIESYLGEGKIARLQDRCQKCKDKSFSRKKEQFCKNVCTTKNIQKDNCKVCKSTRYRTNNPEACSKCLEVTSTTTTTTTTTSTTKAPARSIIETKRKCREERSSSDQCVKLLDKCNSRSFRATHTVCEKREGDAQWLKKKCMSNTFLTKFKSTCEAMCSTDDDFSNQNPELCSTFSEPESLEEIVKKCASLEYYRDNKEKCEVVEKIDLILEDQDSASNQKADIVDSIQRQTEKERKNIKKNTNQKKKKKANSKKKDKSKKKKTEKIKKSKCNKPKYAAIHPKECKKIDMKSVLAKKCRKKKYKTKHRIRCTSIGRYDDTSTALNNEVINEATDKRCRKESFRIQYPKLCSDISVNSEKEESKEWLKERCKHNKFFSKNENWCANLDTIEKEDYEKSISDSADDFELTTTPFTTPTTADFQEEVEVTTETESLTT